MAPDAFGEGPHGRTRTQALRNCRLARHLLNRMVAVRDIANEEGTVIAAMGDGKRAAQAIDEYLKSKKGD